jgi:hypothetical protein
MRGSWPTVGFGPLWALGHGGKKLLDRVPNEITVKNEVSQAYFNGPLPLSKK